jgi:Ca2+/Na+ antiporter
MEFLTEFASRRLAYLDDDYSGFQFSDFFVDVATLPDNAFGMIQLLFLTIIYALFLYYGSELISNGSELLLLIPSFPAIIGSVVLPVLGAVPEAAIVVFSGIGSAAQSQLEIGIGALAGSTIMLLTIPWFLVIVAGRVNIDNGIPRYVQPKLVPSDNFSLFETGVVVNGEVQTATVVALVSSLSYLLIEIPAFVYRDESDDEIPKKEYAYAIATFLLCMIFLFSYTLYSYYTADNEEKVVVDIDEVLTTSIRRKFFPLDVAIIGILNDKTTHAAHSGKLDDDTDKSAESSGLLSMFSLGNKREETGQIDRVNSILKSFYDEARTDGEDVINVETVLIVMDSIGEQISLDQLRELSKRNNLSGTDLIPFEEFSKICVGYAQDKVAKSILSEADAIEKYTALKDDIFADDESQVMPEDLEPLSFEEQQSSLKFRAFWMMSLGTTLIVLFSDPIVDCFSEIADRINVGSFYVAFLLAPLASNASELYASYSYALRKTPKSIGISLSTLMGATVMNNTVVLGVFMLVVFTQGLYYEFFAETLAILVVEVIVAIYAFKGLNTVADGFFILSLFPLSLVFTYLLYLPGWG